MHLLKSWNLHLNQKLQIRKFDFISKGSQLKHSKSLKNGIHPKDIASYTLLGLESLFGIETTILDFCKHFKKLSESNLGNIEISIFL